MLYRKKDLLGLRAIKCIWWCKRMNVRNIEVEAMPVNCVWTLPLTLMAGVCLYWASSHSEHVYNHVTNYSYSLFSLYVYSFSLVHSSFAVLLSNTFFVYISESRVDLLFEATGIKKCTQLRCYCVWYTTTLPCSAVTCLWLELLQCEHFSSRSHWQMRAITVHLDWLTHLSVSWLLFLTSLHIFSLPWCEKFCKKVCLD